MGRPTFLFCCTFACKQHNHDRKGDSTDISALESVGMQLYKKTYVAPDTSSEPGQPLPAVHTQDSESDDTMNAETSQRHNDFCTNEKQIPQHGCWKPLSAHPPDARTSNQKREELQAPCSAILQFQRSCA